MSLPKSKQRPAGERVYAVLRDNILSLKLKPDTTVSRNEVADEFGVSQSPVREAIHKLELDGLVISYPQSRTVVSKIDLQHARETLFLRRSVEIEIARELAKGTDGRLLAPARRILHMQRLAGEDMDIGEFTALDQFFHLSMFEAAGFPALFHAISARSGHLDRLRRLNLPDPGKIAEILEQHDRILTAIRDGDAAAAASAVRTHLSGTLAASDEIKRKYPDFFVRE